MDFGIDDALDSDDSFFDDPKPTGRRSSTTKTGEKEKKTIDELFNFMDQTTATKKTEQDGTPQVTFDLPSDKKELATATTKPEKRTDFLEDLLPSSNKTIAPAGTQNKPSTDLIDDILPSKTSLRRNPSTAETTSKKPASINFSDILKDSKAAVPSDKNEELLSRDNPTRKSALKPTVSEPKSASNFPSLEEPQSRMATGRRGSRTMSTGVEDVLGIFGSTGTTGNTSEHEFSSIYYNKNKNKENDNVSETRSVNVIKESKDIPDWLGGGSTTTAKSDTTISTQKTEKSTAVSETKSENTLNSKITGTEEPHEKPSNSVITTINSSNYETLSLQNSYSNLQQQESFLLVSLQMKKYEENLTDIKKKQEEILQKQENQLELLLNKYEARQESIENEVRLQQERINNHIKLLIGEGAPMLRKKSEDSGIERQPQDSGSEEIERSTEESSKVVKSLKQRHEEEMFLMEESYKKQLSLLESSADSVEKRLNLEVERITTEFEEKIAALHKNYKDEIKRYIEKFENITETHNEELRIMKESHMRRLDDLKSDHIRQIEYMKNQMDFENQLLQDKNLYSQKLDDNVNILENNSKILHNLQESVANTYTVFNIAREKSIESKEKELSLMRKSLDECREKAEIERSQLMGLVTTLESKIAEQNHNAKEERWALTQAAATFAARSAALDRETEYNRATLDREREQLKTLKESILQEQETIALRLTEEKLQLSAEKQRFEISRKLTNNYEVERVKTEAESAIQVAKELAEKLNLERDSLHRQKTELEQVRRNLVDKEHEISQKESELEHLTKIAQGKINESRKNITQAKYLEQKYQEKLAELNEQSTLMASREKKFAEEKLWLSKERLTLYNTVNSKRKNNRDCVLCKSENNDAGTQQRVDQFLGHALVEDLDAIRIRLELDEDEEDRNNEVSKEENSIIVQ